MKLHHILMLLVVFLVGAWVGTAFPQTNLIAKVVPAS